MDNAAFDRLARLLGSGASRRQALRAVAVAALAGGTAKELFAAPKKKGLGKGKNKKKKTKNNGNGGSGGTGGGNGQCAGTTLKPGQDFLGCDYAGRNLREKDLHSSSFKDVDLSEADLCGANLRSVSIADSDLSGANLTDVDLDSSSHSKSDYSGANFTGVSLRQSTISKSSFAGVNLTRADLTGSTFDEVDFSGAIFCRTIRPDGTIDDRDCDACENTCGFCENCDDEQCNPPTCCIDPETGDGICTDTDTDTDNCGQCNRLCLSSTNPCISVDCIGGQCVDVAADDGDPCRAQGQDGVCCAAGSTVTCVIGGVCCSAAQCDESETCCSGQCVDTDTDPDNCGGCGPEFACDPDQVCEQGQCVDDECDTDEVRCDGICTPGVCCADDQTGPQCPAGQTCVAGGCVGEGQYRIVLRWAAAPADIDSHLWLPTTNPFHIYYNRTGDSAAFPFAELDIDDTTSFGPETITIFQPQTGTYRFGVYNYFDKCEDNLAESGATVQLFRGGTMLDEWDVPTNDTSAPWWHVFDLTFDANGNGAVTEVNQLVAAAPAPAGYNPSEGENDQSCTVNRRIRAEQAAAVKQTEARGLQRRRLGRSRRRGRR
jgi:hypothetical protein